MGRFGRVSRRLWYTGKRIISGRPESWTGWSGTGRKGKIMSDRQNQIDQWVRAVAVKIGSPVETPAENEWKIILSGVPIRIQQIVSEKRLLFTVPFVPVPAARRAEFFEMLLVRNLSVRFGAYAIRGKDVVFCDSIATADLDSSEFLASLNSISDEVKYTLDFLREFGQQSAGQGNFEQSIGNFTFAEDPAQRKEALEMLHFAVGADGVRHFLESFRNLEGQEYLPAEQIAAILG